jgi:hypothetical protein
MKKFLFIGGIAFSVTLAVVIGTRLSPDAMAVVVGIVCGVLASIPTSAILVWVLRVRDKQLEAQLGQNRAYGGQYPPVVVVNGQGTHGNGQHPPPVALPTGNNGGGRSFKIVGQENSDPTGELLPPFWEGL